MVGGVGGGGELIVGALIVGRVFMVGGVDAGSVDDGSIGDGRELMVEALMVRGVDGGKPLGLYDQALISSLFSK